MALAMSRVEQIRSDIKALQEDLVQVNAVLNELKMKPNPNETERASIDDHEEAIRAINKHVAELEDELDDALIAESKEKADKQIDEDIVAPVTERADVVIDGYECDALMVDVIASSVRDHYDAIRECLSDRSLSRVEARNWAERLFAAGSVLDVLERTPNK